MVPKQIGVLADTEEKVYGRFPGLYEHNSGQINPDPARCDPDEKRPEILVQAVNMKAFAYAEISVGQKQSLGVRNCKISY